MPADGTTITRSPLHEAELAYEEAVRETPGVTRAEVDLDILRFGLVAATCADTARKAWREVRSTQGVTVRREFDLTSLARQIADACADTLGLSREAALVLDELVKAEFS